MQLKDLVGVHKFSGVDYIPSTRSNEEQFKYMELGNDVIFCLDNVNFLLTENECDGYRSCMEDLEITDRQIKNTFPPQYVKCDHYTFDECGNKSDILKIFSMDDKLILEVGTDNTDDYYPYTVFNYYPENMDINKDVNDNVNDDKKCCQCYSEAYRKLHELLTAESLELLNTIEDDCECKVQQNINIDKIIKEKEEFNDVKISALDLRFFNIGDVVRHFKYETLTEAERDQNMYEYVIRCFATDADTDEELVIYQALYGNYKTYARSMTEFASLVDREKYPNIRQMFRFEIIRSGSTSTIVSYNQD